MKINLITFICCVTMWSCNLKNQEVSQLSAYSFTQDSIAIIDVLNSQKEAWNNADINSFMKGYLKNEELTFIGSRGVTYGWQNTLENYKKGYPDSAAMGNLQFNIISVKSLGEEAAQVIGQFILTRENDKPSGYFSLVFQKVKGDWVITSDMTASTPQEE